jgi:hypothetical protein
LNRAGTGRSTAKAAIDRNKVAVAAGVVDVRAVAAVGVEAGAATATGIVADIRRSLQCGFKETAGPSATVGMTILLKPKRVLPPAVVGI